MDGNVTALATTAASLPAATGGTELLIQLLILVTTVVFGAIGYFGVKWLHTSAYAKKYNLDNERTERILGNAVAWAESFIKTQGASYIDKRKLSVDYFNKVAPDLVKKYGDALNDMVARKAEQLNSTVGLASGNTEPPAEPTPPSQS